MDSQDEKNNDLSVIANHYFKPKVYYINCSNVNWNYEDMPKYLQFKFIDSIIREFDISSEQKKLIRNLTISNIKKTSKSPFTKLNRDVIINIENYAIDYSVLFKILRKIWIKQYRKQIDNLVNENQFDKMWYDFDSNDYHYAKVALEDLNYLSLKLNVNYK